MRKQDTGLEWFSPEEKSINLMDILLFLLSYWKWFLISILIFGGYFWYDYCKTPFMYYRSAVVMIKTPANTQTTMRMNRYNSFISGPVNVASEILQFNSRELMRKVVKRLDANVSYTIKAGFRDNELYSKSPVKISFLELMEDEPVFLTASLLPDAKVSLSGFPSYDEELIVTLKDTVETPIGKLYVETTPHFNEKWLRKIVQVKIYPLEEMINYYLSQTAIVQMDNDASLIQMSIKDHSPLRAADMLDMMISVYNEGAIEDKNRIAINTAEFIKERLAIIEKDLGTVEGSLERLKIANEGIDVTATTGMYIADVQRSQSLAKELDAQLQLVQFMTKYLAENNNTDNLIPNNTGLVDDIVENKIVEYNRLLLRKKRLIEGKGGNNPVVKDMNQSLLVMRDDIIRAVDNQLNTLKIKLNEINQQNSKVRGKMQALPELQRKMLSVERQQKVKEELYLFLLNKREENALNQAMTDNNVRVLDPPSGSNHPIYPVKYRKLVTGIGCGIACPTIILILSLILDTRVRSKREIESVVTAPFICEIPQVKKINGNEEIRVNIQGRDPLSEAFRILRTNLGFMLMQSQVMKVITLTSFSVGAGKTFVATNLSACLSQMKKKVVVVDLDLRKGTLSSLINSKRHTVGIIHYLTDLSVTVDQIISKDALSEGMDIIPVGTIAPNPTELLVGSRLDELVSQLKERYDYVIVDNVPMGLVADAVIVNRISDLTLFVVRSGKLDRRMLPELEKIYQERKLKNLAVLLNGSNNAANSYGYGYGYIKNDESIWHKVMSHLKKKK